MKRKIDYYYAPYGTVYFNEKFMNFDESVDNTRIIKKDKLGRPFEEFLNPHY